MIPPCLTLSNIKYVSRVEWNNPGKGVALSPTLQCSSYWKGSLLVTLNYGHLLFLFIQYSIISKDIIIFPLLFGQTFFSLLVLSWILSKSLRWIIIITNSIYLYYIWHLRWSLMFVSWSVRLTLNADNNKNVNINLFQLQDH